MGSQKVGHGWATNTYLLWLNPLCLAYLLLKSIKQSQQILVNVLIEASSDREGSLWWQSKKWSFIILPKQFWEFWNCHINLKKFLSAMFPHQLSWKPSHIFFGITLRQLNVSLSISREISKLQIEKALMSHRNRVPVSHKSIFLINLWATIVIKGMY